jgi:hypothetical protein
MFLKDWFSYLNAFAQWCFEYLAQVSKGMAALDQWISYVVSRFAPLKTLFEMMVRPVQALCSLLFGILGSFGQLFAKVFSVARIVPNSAANADVVGRWFLSGWIHNMWQRLNHQHAAPTESRSNSKHHVGESATEDPASSSSRNDRSIGQNSSHAHHHLKKHE